MGYLQDLLDSTIKEQITEELCSKIYIKRKAELLGISLTESQIEAIQNTINKADEDDNLEIEVVKDNVKYKISLLEGDENEVDELVMPVVRDLIKELTIALKETYTKYTLARLKKDKGIMILERKKDQAAFQKELTRSWKKPIDLLELFIAIVLEAGDRFTNETREDAIENQDLVLDVMARLHARACQISSEILTLLKNGYADGAHARWRSLHEIVVISFFIKENGAEVAERYLLHEGIENYKAAEEYQKYHITLKKEPIEEKDMMKIKELYENLILQFGPYYKGDYGWAAEALNQKKPTFKDIEEKTLLSHLRPDYKHASFNVHATSKGILSKLSLLSDDNDILPTGPSIYGLVKPGHSVAVSLSQITHAFLFTKINVDRIAICHLISELEKEIGEEFIWSGEKLKNIS